MIILYCNDVDCWTSIAIRWEREQFSLVVVGIGLHLLESFAL